MNNRRDDLAEKKQFKPREGLKNLNINTLSLAKFFYQRNIKSSAVIQRLIYLTFIEVLKEKNALLFDEEWQAWSGGPIVNSLFKVMSKHLDKHDDYEKLFANVIDTENKEILSFLEKTYHDYQIHKEKKEEYIFFEKALDKPWQLARHGLIDELDHKEIKLDDILDYVSREKTHQEIGSIFHYQLVRFLLVPESEPKKISKYEYYYR